MILTITKMFKFFGHRHIILQTALHAKFLRNSTFPKLLGKRSVRRATGNHDRLFSTPGTDPWCEDKHPDASRKSKHKHLVEADCDRVNMRMHQINRCSEPVSTHQEAW
jgi:hypothetical protein